MDLRTLLIAQTCALVATAAMLWIARSEADRRNGLQTWMLAVTAQGIAYLLLANAGRLPVLATGLLANALGALGVALFFVAIRQFLGLPYRMRWLAAMVALVTTVATAAGADYAGATIFNGFAYGVLELLNGIALWRAPRQAGLVRVQRVVAAAFLLMGLVLPMRAVTLALDRADFDYLNMPLTWQQPIYVFGFLFIIVTNLGFMQMCKMRAEAEVLEQAMTDGLTGLANRRSLDAALDDAAAAAQPLAPFSIVMIDVDHFKQINDRFGHRSGDASLAAFAERLRRGLRAQDIAFRYGGEEFCVLLPRTDAAGARTLAERLHRQVALEARGEMPAQTASLGVAVWRDGDTADDLLGRADQALYRAKASGRDRVEVAG